MKKVIYASLFIILCLIIIYPFNTKADETLEKGDLRCPSEYLNNGCVEVVEDGKVTEVRVTEKDGDTEVTKIVTKKSDKIGYFDVKFLVKGGESKVVKKKDAYIILILDTSASIRTSWDKAKSAIKTFGQNENIKGSNFMVIQFANHLSNKVKKYSTISKNSFDVTTLFSSTINVSNLCSYNSCGMQTASRIELALKYANTVLSHSGMPDTANKYVVVFGDGFYYNEDDTCWSKRICGHDSAVPSREKLMDAENNRTRVTDVLSTIKKNAKFYGIIYPGTGKDKESFDYMQKIVGDNIKDARKNTNYTQFFNEIAESIGQDQENDTVMVSGVITDRLGDDFLVGTSSKDQVIDVKNINLDGVYTKSFEIHIDDYADTGWHDTNSGFDLEIEGKKITSNINPEVYWKGDSTDILACSDTINKNSRTVESSSYYTITCEQGYGKTDGYNVDLKTFNLENGTNSFTLTNGEGFPIDLNLVSNLRCTYSFDTTSYLADYNSLQSQYDSLKDDEKESKDAYSILKSMQDMEKILDTWNNISGVGASELEPLREYREKFETQKVRYNIKYKTKDSEEGYLENVGDIQNDLSCSVENRTNIIGRTIYTNRVCSLTSSKKMQIPLVCLSMQTADQEECISDFENNQIYGGNKFYALKSEKKGGFVSVFVDNATLTNDSFELVGDKKDDNHYRCEFNVNNLNLVFRQIDVNDPFIQKDGSNRTIGKNYANSRYNFVQIIKSDIWSNSPFKTFYMGKENVENIKNDTLSEAEKVSSYLGTDCYINPNDNTYTCSFVSDTVSSLNKSFFTRIETGGVE